MAIEFWSTTGPHGAFSNFSRHPVVISNKRYKTTEHYYQSQKFATTDPLYANKIAKATLPKEAARLGRDKKRKLLRKDWESVKLDVMRRALKAKIEQHEDVKELLLETGDEKIVETSPYDFFWGAGDDGSGQNWLGRLWMELRSELRGEAKPKLKLKPKAEPEPEETDEEFVDAVFAGLTPRSLQPKVWNKRKGSPKAPKGAIYVGRPSKWGNPFVLNDESYREEVLAQYEEWLMSKPELIAEVKRELKGKHLLCWCAPRMCHADVLLRVANEE